MSGVGIADVYQMLAYSVKLDVKMCHLLYPPSIDINDTLSGYYQIEHNSNNDISRVYYHRLTTIISDCETNLEDLISNQEDELRNQLAKIIYE